MQDPWAHVGHNDGRQRIGGCGLFKNLDFASTCNRESRFRLFQTRSQPSRILHIICSFAVRPSIASARQSSPASRRLPSDQLDEASFQREAQSRPLAHSIMEDQVGEDYVHARDTPSNSTNYFDTVSQSRRNLSPSSPYSQENPVNAHYGSHGDHFTTEALHYAKKHQHQHSNSTPLLETTHNGGGVVPPSPQSPSAMTVENFMKTLAYFGQWRFESLPGDHGYFAAEAFYFSSAGHMVWQLLSPQTQTRFLMKWNTQLRKMKIEEGGQLALHQAVTHLAGLHWMNRADYVNATQGTELYPLMNSFGVTMLFEMLLYRAKCGSNTKEQRTTLEHGVRDWFLGSNAGDEVLAQAKCLARILGRREALRLGPECRDFEAVLHLQLQHDGHLSVDLETWKQESMHTSRDAVQQAQHDASYTSPSQIVDSPQPMVTPTAVSSVPEWIAYGGPDTDAKTPRKGQAAKARATDAATPHHKPSEAQLDPSSSSAITPPATVDTSPTSDEIPPLIKGIGPMPSIYDDDLAGAVDRYRNGKRTPLGCGMDSEALDEVERDTKVYIDRIYAAIRAGPVDPTDEEPEGIEALESYVKKIEEGTVEEDTKVMACTLFYTTLDFHREGHTLNS